jgi:hypothetical protein
MWPVRTAQAFEQSVNVTFGWLDLAWAWIGLVAAVVLLVALFATARLRSDLGVRRRADPRWVGFLAVAVYLVHQFEEYGIAANGRPHAFPDELCAIVGQPAYPACAIPPEFYLAVNITLVWVAAPIAAALAPRVPLFGLVLWGVIAANAVVHIVPAIGLLRYDPGLLTAAILFVPLAIWALSGITGHQRSLPWWAFVPMLGAGVLMHAVLGVSLLLFLRANLPAWALVTLQPLAVISGYALALMVQSTAVLKRHRTIRSSTEE